MQIAVAGMLNSDLATAVILIGDTGYRQKQQTLRHLNSTIGINGYVSNELTEILDDLHKFSSLRNQVAHCTWTKGRKEGLIKPMQLILRTKEPTPLGHHHNEQNYGAEDLSAAALELKTISQRLDALLDSSRLTGRVEAKIEAIKESTAASPGKPSSK